MKKVLLVLTKFKTGLSSYKILAEETQKDNSSIHNLNRVARLGAGSGNGYYLQTCKEGYSNLTDHVVTL